MLATFTANGRISFLLKLAWLATLSSKVVVVVPAVIVFSAVVISTKEAAPNSYSE